MIRNALKESKKVFSLRKLSMGLCSVALGTVLLVVQNTSVDAATTDQQQIETIKRAETQTESNVVVQAETASQEKKTVDNKELKPQSEQKGKQGDAVTIDQQPTETQSNKNPEAQIAVPDHRQVIVNDDKRQESQSVLNDTVANRADESNALNTAKTESTVQDNKKVSSALGEEVAKKIGSKTSIDSTATSVNKTNELTISKAGNKVNLSQAASQKIVYSNQWVIRNGKSYYYDGQGHQIRNQWAAPTGTLHYFGNEGYTIENQWYTMPDGNSYYFDYDGHKVINRWYTMPDGNSYYFGYDGHRAINRWYTMSDGNSYYFGYDGHRVINRWYTMSDGNSYYFGYDGHRVLNRWHTM